jgi:hypothetical protein
MEAREEDWEGLSKIANFVSHAEQRKRLPLFGELDAELDYCEFLIRSQIHKGEEAKFKNKKQRRKELPSEMARTLAALSPEELIAHFCLTVQMVVALTSGDYRAPALPSKAFLISGAFSRSYTLKIWKRKKLRFDQDNHIIYAEKDKRVKTYDLANYLVRKSCNTDYTCLVLEAINEVPYEKCRTVHLGFEFKNSFLLWFQAIRVSIRYRQWQRLVRMLNKRPEVDAYQAFLHEQEVLQASQIEDAPQPSVEGPQEIIVFER